MDVKALNCPQCGAPLPVERNALITICDFCSSRIKITLDPTGALTASVMEVVDLVSQQTILDHLNQEYAPLVIEQQALERKISNYQEIITSKSEGKKNFWGAPRKLSQEDEQYVKEIQKQLALAERRMALLESQLGQLRKQISIRQDQVRRLRSNIIKKG